MKKYNTKYYLIFIGFLWGGCAEPNRPYSSELRHTEPGVQYMADVDMYYSPSYETYSANPLFADSKTAREPVPGTIARGHLPYPYPNTNEGYEQAGKELKNPMPPAPETTEDGKALFMTFCDHCHGETGQGDGILVKNGEFPPPPSYSTGMSSGGGDMRNLPEGKIFHVITYGRNLMGAHGPMLSPEERWKIVHFVQKLQQSDFTGTKPPAETASAGQIPMEMTITQYKAGEHDSIVIMPAGKEGLKIKVEGAAQLKFLNTTGKDTTQK